MVPTRSSTRSKSSHEMWLMVIDCNMREVLVIGGGWAGIAAAMEAARNGWRVTMVEERPYLGGRARSFTDRMTGEEIDNGQHLMMGCYHEAMQVLRELGTDLNIERQSALRVRFVDVDGGSDILDAGLIPGAAGVAIGI
ncbi:MAG: FAD-dependent oxidoreductase, partial [Ignavibacteriae bacterium]